MTSAYEAGGIPEIQVHHRLRIAREWANLEQEELAERMGITRQSVGSAERGRTKPRKITLNAWALACGVPASWLREVVDRRHPPAAAPGDVSGAARSRRRLPRVDSNHQPSGHDMAVA